VISKTFHVQKPAKTGRNIRCHRCFVCARTCDQGVDYLRSFKSPDPQISSTSLTSKDPLEDYLLERAAGKLQAAKTRRDKR
jgi:polyferredoxin